MRSKEFDRFRDITPLGPTHGLAPVDTLTDRLSDIVGDFYQGMVYRRDSLLLTRPQVAALQAADTVYMAKANAVWREVAVYAATIEPNGDLQELIRAQGCCDRPRLGAAAFGDSANAPGPYASAARARGIDARTADR